MTRTCKHTLTDICVASAVSIFDGVRVVRYDEEMDAQEHLRIIDWHGK